MSKTPICDFVNNYAQKNALRLHMPGHKGIPLLGFEALDITEFDGADSLYEASSIIAQSEQIASDLFGSACFYSTEGSSQCIRAMLYLARLYALKDKKPLRIAAGRNAHKVFLSAAALLDWEVSWLISQEKTSYLSCPIEPVELDAFLQKNPVAAVYVTSPDYLGNLLDIGALAEEQLFELNKRFSYVRIDKYIIMPNHIHLIVELIGDPIKCTEISRPDLYEIIGTYKSITTRICNKNFNTPGRKLFQTSFYESVIRSEQGYYEAYQYIEGNPARWVEKYGC